MPDRITRAQINLANYKHNLLWIRQTIGEDVALMAVVKANAYGHGLEQVSLAAASVGVNYLGVATIGELKRIRKAGVVTPILLLGYIDSDSIADALEHNATITVMDGAFVEALNEIAETKDRIVKVHLKVDTGMHRAGCDLEDAVQLVEQISTCSNLELEGTYTHFAESETANSDFTSDQLAKFTNYLERLDQKGLRPKLIHCANSAATIALHETHFTMVRPGLITYGLNPFTIGHSNYDAAATNLRPVLFLESRVVLTRTIEAGESVGYNRRWTASRRSQLALIPIGYGDGWRRSPSNAGRVIIHGQYAPIVGSVSMDQTVVDVTDISDVKVGDTVTLIGKDEPVGITVDDVAAMYNTINYEVVVSLNERITRNYTD